MNMGVPSAPRGDILGALTWLIDAGVDTIVADQPGCWLRAQETPVAAAAESKNIENTSPIPAAPSGLSLEPLVEGLAGAPVILVMDADPRAGVNRILADTEQRLLQRMLAAIGLDVDHVTRLGLRGASSPLAGGHVALLLGDGPSRALLDKPVAAARGAVHRIGDVSVIATFAPAFLISQPRAKAHAWADLRLLAETLNNAR